MKGEDRHDQPDWPPKLEVPGWPAGAVLECSREKGEPLRAA